MAESLEPAPFLKRLLANAVDLGILTALTYVLILVALLAFGGVAGIGTLLKLRAQDGGVDAAAALQSLGGIAAIAGVLVFLLALLALYHSYFIYYEYKAGATPGKKLFGLRVVDSGPDGGAPTLKQCIWREAMRDVDVFIVLPGLICMAATERQQRIGDLVAKTCVVHSAAREREAESMYLAAAEYDRLKTELEPRPVPRELCRELLAFAYPCLALGSRRPGEAELARWEAEAAAHVPRASERGLGGEGLLRFFAEHCFRTLNGG